MKLILASLLLLVLSKPQDKIPRIHVELKLAGRDTEFSKSGHMDIGAISRFFQDKRAFAFEFDTLEVTVRFPLQRGNPLVFSGTRGIQRYEVFQV